MRILGKRYKAFESEDKTKARLLLLSAKLFALRGFASVSMREIATEAGIRPSSIYNHYDGKESVLQAILDKGITYLQSYYEARERADEAADSFAQIVMNQFIELKSVPEPFIYYAINVAHSTQYQFEMSQILYYDCFVCEGRRVIRRQLDRAIERNLVEPFDTEAVTLSISNAVIVGNQLRVGQLNGYYADYDFYQHYKIQEDFILRITKQI